MDEEGDTERRGCHVYSRLKQELPYRRKVTASLAVYGIFAVIGGIKGQIGPAFLDLQSICDVGLEEGGWIVTSLYIGYTLGALANGFLYHRCNGSLLFSISAMCLTVLVAVIPWCTHYILMIACHSGMGLMVGLIDAAGNAEIIRLWKTRSKTVLVGLHVIFNLGGVISPLIIAPFLLRNDDARGENSTAVPNQIDTVTLDRVNISSQHSSNLLPRPSAINTSAEYEYENVSMIYIAYSISSFFCVVHTLWFIFLYFTEKGSNDESQMTIEHSTDQKLSNGKANGHSYEQGNPNDRDHLSVQEYSTGTVNGHSKAGEARISRDIKHTYNGPIPRELQFLGLVVMVIIGAISNAIDFSFSTYLSSLCVELLHWSKASGSLITSLLFIMVVIGGTMSMLLTKCINSIVYIGLQVVLILVSLILFLFSIKFKLTVGIWLSAPLLGFAKSAIFPLVISWTNKTFIQVSGRISSVFFVGAMGGSSVNLFMLASVMESMGKIWFCYILIVESILLILFFITTLILSQFVKHWKRKEAAKAKGQESTDIFIDG